MKRFGSLLIVLALVATACGGDDDTTETTTPTTSATTTTTATSPGATTTTAPAPDLPKLDTMTKVRFASWGPPTSDTSFFWTGVEKGFWAEENIDFEWVAGNGTADALRRVIAGDVDFAWSSADAVLFGAEQEADVKHIFTLWGNIYEIIYLPAVCDCEVNSINDLVGRTVGVQSQSSITRLILLQALAGAGLTEEDFDQEINVGFDPASPLVGGQIDTYTSWPNLTLFVQSLEGLEDLAVWPIADVNFPGDGIAVSDDTWQNRPLVESFIRAFIKSIKYELANPEEVAGFLGEYVGTTETPEQLLPQIENNAKQILGIADGREADVEAFGLGYVPIESAGSAQQIFLDADIMTTEVDIGPLFTNELVEKYKDWGDS